MRSIAMSTLRFRIEALPTVLVVIGVLGKSAYPNAHPLSLDARTRPDRSFSDILLYGLAIRRALCVGVGHAGAAAISSVAFALYAELASVRDRKFVDDIAPTRCAR